jgi:predicted dehydrogenase
MAIHHFDILRYITGMYCLEVFADSFNPSWSWYAGGAATSVLLRFELDFRVNYFATWVTPGEEDSWPGEIRIEGEKGSIRLNARGEVTLNCNGSTKLMPHPVMVNAGRAHALSQFRSGLAGESTPGSVISDNIKSYAIVRAAIKSVQTGQPVRVERLLHPESIDLGQ